MPHHKRGPKIEVKTLSTGLMADKSEKLRNNKFRSFFLLATLRIVNRKSKIPPIRYCYLPSIINPCEDAKKTYLELLSSTISLSFRSRAVARKLRRCLPPVGNQYVEIVGIDTILRQTLRFVVKVGTRVESRVGY